MIRAALEAVRAPLACLPEPKRIALGAIVGLDPCNSRREEPDAQAIESLARAIVEEGQIAPLLLRPSANGFSVLAGGRRWRALQWIEAHLAPVDAVSAIVCVVADDEARELSLAENFHRENLHPLAEAERFAELVRGASVRAVADAMGVKERFVRQRLKFAELPENAKRAWREGRFGVATAEALASGAPENAADLVATRPDLLEHPAAVRAAQRPRGVAADSPGARFVGLAAYVAAGGAVDEDLFGDEKRLTDGALLKRLERDKQAKIGALRCDQDGWRGYTLDPDEVPPARVDPDFLEDERIELATLEKRDDDAAGVRMEAIIHRATLRAVPSDVRGDVLIHPFLDTEGRLFFEYGLILSVSAVPTAPKTEPSSSAAANPSPAEDEERTFAREAAKATRQPETLRSAPPAHQPDLSPSARHLALAAASRAAAQQAASHDSLSLILATAALAHAGRGPTPVRLTRVQGAWGSVGVRTSEIVRAGRSGFVAALEVAANLQPSECQTVFFELVASALDLRGAGNMEAVAVLRVVLRFVPDFADLIAKELPYPDLFREAGRGFSLAVLRELTGLGSEDRAWLDTEKLALEAARIAKARRWLPEFLRVA